MNPDANARRDEHFGEEPSLDFVYAVADAVCGVRDMTAAHHAQARMAAILLLDLADQFPDYLAAVLRHHHAWREQAEACQPEAAVFQRRKMAEIRRAVPLAPVRLEVGYGYFSVN